MIGDWVCNTHNRKNERVAETRSESVMLYYNDLYEYDEIEPIPLTPEMLEKNGFNHEGISYVFGALQVTFDVDWGDLDNQISLYIENALDMKIQYVHELQHMLRLFRIDKEIEL